MRVKRIDHSLPRITGSFGIVDLWTSVVEERVVSTRVCHECKTLTRLLQLFGEIFDRSRRGIIIMLGEESEDRSIEICELRLDIRVDAVVINANANLRIFASGKHRQLPAHAKTNNADFLARARFEA